MAVTDDIAAYLKGHEAKPLLRFITCGSVDDGKSTLIGRLLYDSKRLFDDQLAALASDSRRHGTQGERIDYALLLDGLEAEREQGITIDVAYRYFDTDKRKFIVADCPGHEQYTRNMATGASTADLAVVLVDARKGLLAQTRRHSYIVSLFGIRNVVLAVNKMDLVGYSQETFEAIAEAYRELAAQLGIANVQCIPLSALEGDNLAVRSANTPWYAGPALLEHLEAVDASALATRSGLRLPVQWVNRPNQDFRGFAGTIAAGTVKPGDAVVALPSARRST
ncbi:MAG TPA: GTP-binding protein, partial [Pseudoxanthomonas sp.]|nr:GTP-binding protein [Pseudoxanthomonas sp.]